MPAANQVIALLAGHLNGDSEQVRTIALQIAADHQLFVEMSVIEGQGRLVGDAPQQFEIVL